MGPGAASIGGGGASDRATPRRARALPGLIVFLALLALSRVAVSEQVVQAGTVVKVAEPAGAISVRTELPVDGKVVRSFRLEQGAPSAASASLSFLPSDLVSNSERIDRSALQVVDPKPLGQAPQDYRLQVDGIKAPGTYTGAVEIRSSLTKGVVQTVPVSLVVLPRQPIALSAETPKLGLKLASSCGWLTRSVLGATACPGVFRFNLSGWGTAERPSDVRLLLSGSDGALPAKGGSGGDAAGPQAGGRGPAASASYRDGQLLLEVPRSRGQRLTR